MWEAKLIISTIDDDFEFCYHTHCYLLGVFIVKTNLNKNNGNGNIDRCLTKDRLMDGWVSKQGQGWRLKND